MTTESTSSAGTPPTGPITVDLLNLRFTPEPHNPQIEEIEFDGELDPRIKTNGDLFAALGASPILQMNNLEGYDADGVVRLRCSVWFTPDGQTAYVVARYRFMGGSTPGPRSKPVYYRCTIPGLRWLLAAYGLGELDHNLARLGLVAPDAPATEQAGQDEDGSYAERPVYLPDILRALHAEDGQMVSRPLPRPPVGTSDHDYFVALGADPELSFRAEWQGVGLNEAYPVSVLVMFSPDMQWACVHSHHVVDGEPGPGTFAQVMFRDLGPTLAELGIDLTGHLELLGRGPSGEPLASEG